MEENPFFNFTGGVEPGLSFFAASPFSTTFCGRVRAFGDSGFLDVLAWAPADEETHLYLEVLGATITGLSFRGNFLAGVLLLTAAIGELSLAAPPFDPNTGATVTTLPAGEEMELPCLGSPPPVLWFFTQVNLDFFKKGAPTRAWLV